MLAAVLIPAAASAQEPADSAAPYRKWNASLGLQMSFWPTDDAVVRIPAWNVDVARFWTPHVETSATLTANAESTYEFVSTTALPSATIDVNNVAKPAGLRLAGTYQFYENVFAHPYVSAGAQFGWFETERVTYSRTGGVVAVETIRRSVLTRPFVAGGFKSYFDNGRAFMRSELAVFVAPKGSPTAVVRIGFGFEF